MNLLAAGLQGPSIDWFSLSPILVLLGGALVLLVVAALTPTWPKHLYALYTAAIALAMFVLAIVLWHQIDREGNAKLVGDALVVDKPALWLIITLAVALFLAAL